MEAVAAAAAGILPLAFSELISRNLSENTGDTLSSFE